MTTYIHGQPERAARRARRRRTVVVVAVVVAVATVLGLHLAETSRAAAEDRAAASERAATPEAVPGKTPAAKHPAAKHPGTVAGLTAGERKAADKKAATDPKLKGLDPELARRFARAQAAAKKEGVALTLTSGKRSAAAQQKLVDAAVKRYGSATEAHRWVLPPDKSSHVQGLAVDVGPTAGALWLGEHGLALGLCRTYANEVWHFEKLPAGRDTCKPMHPDSSSGWPS